VSDINTAAVDGLKALDSDRPIREADMSVSGLLLCNLSPKPHFAGRNSLKIGVGQLSPSGSVCGAKLNCGLRLRSVKPMASVLWGELETDMRRPIA